MLVGSYNKTTGRFIVGKQVMKIYTESKLQRDDNAVVNSSN